MEIQYPTVEIPATPEYVLSVLLDRETLEWNNDSLSQVGVTLDSSIEVLYETCGFYTFDDIFYSTLICFDLEFSDWFGALRSAEGDTVRDFCELIAARITMPKITLSSFCGRTCRPASVFLTIRSMMHDAGVDVADVAPSTPLKEYTRKNLELFLGPIAKLSPGSLPDFDIDDRGFFSLECLKALWHIPTLVGFFVMGSSPGYFIFTISILLFLYLLVEVDSNDKYASVQIGELRTFRDLAEKIAAHRSTQFS
ncbi:MAG: hypothetical protein P1V19_07380 [Gimesia sp.]|nr:hypothetical protein [Gimesia sp.]